MDRRDELIDGASRFIIYLIYYFEKEGIKPGLVYDANNWLQSYKDYVSLKGEENE